jgi:hypothetical protein
MTVWQVEHCKHERSNFALVTSPYTRYFYLLWIGHHQWYFTSLFSESWTWCLRNAFRI